MKDIAFYLDRARMTGGPVLELGCGTGRVTILLAKAGYEVWGIDFSETMLAECNKKCKTLAPSVRKRLNVLHADWCDFNLGHRFSLIIIPAGSFHLLTDDEQQRACLDCVRKHLTTGGEFIITLKDFTELDASWLQKEEINIAELNDPEGRRMIRQAALRKSIDLKKQVFCYDQIFYIREPDGSEIRVAGPIKLTWFSEKQIRNLLESSGFEIVEAMGDYGGKPISQGQRFIFVCQLRK